MRLVEFLILMVALIALTCASMNLKDCERLDKRISAIEQQEDPVWLDKTSEVEKHEQ